VAVVRGLGRLVDGLDGKANRDPASAEPDPVVELRHLVADGP
jgi:hypothetical protein